jgi:hypothetical protein
MNAKIQYTCSVLFAEQHAVSEQMIEALINVF